MELKETIQLSLSKEQIEHLLYVLQEKMACDGVSDGVLSTTEYDIGEQSNLKAKSHWHEITEEEAKYLGYE